MKNTNYVLNKNIGIVRKNNKIMQKNSKKLINYRIFNKIYKEFYAWLAGIQEDEPMPLEVKYIYFILELKQNDIVLSYSGDENKLKFFDYGFYSPLEGQYFDCYELKLLSYNFFTNKKSISKNDIFDMLKTIVFNVSKKLWFTKDKQVFFGLRFNNIQL